MEELSNLAEKWLEEKKQRMSNLLKIALPDEALYREIMLSLGYPKNKVQFLELALLLPYSEIQKLKTKDLIEGALLFRAGLTDDYTQLPNEFDTSLKMHKSIWTYKGIRPQNFPEKRIQGISNLLAISIDKGLISFFIERIYSQIANSNPKDALKKIMDFNGIGINRKEEIFFNIIFPFMLVYSSDNSINQYLHFLFEHHPALAKNSVVNKFEMVNKIKVRNVKESLGIIYKVKVLDFK
ncbi:MAG: DUF2851 family protein [Bacteroidales bacterium]